MFCDLPFIEATIFAQATMPNIWPIGSANNHDLSLGSHAKRTDGFAWITIAFPVKGSCEMMYLWIGRSSLLELILFLRALVEQCTAPMTIQV